VDARIRAYYDDVRLVTQGPLFTGARWRAIARLNFGPGPAVVWTPTAEISGTYK
jgi:hypothetical protein